METSTPRNTDLRRRTLLTNNANFTASSPLRKSINASVLNNSSMIESNDDDERADRRNQLQIQKRLSVVLTPKAVNLNESFIKEQLVVYTHLYTENKITVKNAWKLQIIDMLRPLCQKNRQDVLQIASTSIDISAKVYSIRVDDVHSEGLKIAGNMARVSENAAVPDNENEEISDKEDEETAGTKKKKKKKRSHLSGVKSTIAKNSSANIGKLPKLEPIDFTTRINADTGTIDNLFTNVLKECSSSFILMDKSKQLIEKVDSIVQNDEKITLNSVELINKQANINAPFHDFRVDQWDPDQEEKQLNAEKSLLSQLEPVVYDDQGFPMHDLDGSFPEDLGNNDDDDDMNDNDKEMEERIGLAPEFRGDIAHVVSFRPMESSVHCSEYSFNSVVTMSNGKYIDQIWAGPSHWKLKCLRRSSTKFSGQKTMVSKETQRPRKRTQPEPIDFHEDVPEINFSKKLILKKRAPTVDIDKITLPLMDQSCARIMANIKELMLKPGVCPVQKKDKSANAGVEDYEVSAYNYENPNDSMYCSQSQPEAGGMDADDNVEEENVFNHAGNLDEHLVDNPETVPNTYIHYALRAKQMDMKKLKTAIWLKLTNPTSTNVEVPQIDAKVIGQAFSDLYKSLPGILSMKEKQELSCPLAFVALLHLCNEQNLFLKQLPGYRDCYITGPNS